MTIKIGLLPIVLAFIFLGLLAAKFARMRGKNPLVWGGLLVAVLVTVTWSRLPMWAETVLYRGGVSERAVRAQGRFVSLAEADKVNIKASVGGVSFDVPLTHNFWAYNTQLRGWSGVPLGQIDGKKRLTVGLIKVDAILPDVSPIGGQSASQLEGLTWGQSLHASIAPDRSWEDYFKYFFEGLQRKPDLPGLPEMLHYYDPTTKADVFMSDDHPTDELVRIRCVDGGLPRNDIPVCIVETPYRPAIPPGISGPNKAAALYLRYEIPLRYAAQWRTIGQRLRLRLDQMLSTN